jgi:hypothetical protein
VSWCEQKVKKPNRGKENTNRKSQIRSAPQIPSIEASVKLAMLADIKTTVSQLYTDVDTRPQLVADLLVSAGANKLLSKMVDEAKATKVIQYVAEATTYKGLSEKATVVKEMAAPYIEKAGNADVCSAAFVLFRPPCICP